MNTLKKLGACAVIVLIAVIGYCVIFANKLNN